MLGAVGVGGGGTVCVRCIGSTCTVVFVVVVVWGGGGTCDGGATWFVGCAG